MIFFQLPQDGEYTSSLIIGNVIHNYAVYAVPSGHPQNVTAVPSDPYTLHLYWNPPPEKEQNGELLYYGIKVKNIDTEEVSQYNTGGPQPSFVLRSLHPHTIYQYALTVFTAVGNGPYSSFQTVQMPSAGKP